MEKKTKEIRSNGTLLELEQDVNIIVEYTSGYISMLENPYLLHKLGREERFIKEQAPVL